MHAGEQTGAQAIAFSTPGRSGQIGHALNLLKVRGPQEGARAHGLWVA
jgi:hypothetical protein